jgi:hypothetical protein
MIDKKKGGTDMWGQGQICLSTPQLTAHGWKRDGMTGINQNFYGFLKFCGNEEICEFFLALRE